MNATDDGFTLIETLIAFMIFALGLMMSTQTIALATKSLLRAQDDRAVLAALGRIKVTFQESDRPAPHQEGSDGLTRWRAEQVPVSDERNREAQFTIVQITSPAGRNFEFIRFVKPEQ